MKSNLFIQSEAFPDVAHLQLEADSTPVQVKMAVLELLPQGAVVADFIVLVEDNDELEAVELLTVIPEGLRLHLHRLKEIVVTVRYAGRDVRREFRPSATIGRVHRWSCEHFGIKPSDAAELRLQVSGSDLQPDADVHVGTLVKHPKHSIVFDLVPAPRING